MHFIVHNDAPIVPPDMMRLLWATTNRITRSGQTLGPEHALTVQEALAAITSEAAYQNFEEDIKGSITVGKLADITILSQDLLTVADDDIMDTEIVMTILGGVVRYQAGEIVN